jgi:hypothetical protein
MGLFSTAKTIAAPKTAKAKKEKLEIAMPQLQQLAEIKALMASLEGVAKSLEGELKSSGFEKFLEMAGSSRPESFRGVDGMASASIEMRKRGTNSALNEDEIATLKQLGIEPFEQTITTEMFGINPEYAADAKLMAKVETALSKVTGLPSDFIVKQEGRSKFVVSDEMLTAGFEKKHRAAIEIMTTMAIKPKLEEGYPMEALFDNVKEIVQPSKKAKLAKLPGAKAA